MPNHVHLILVPSHEDGLRTTLGEAHRQYTRTINRRNKWTGHLWQGRFGSVAMDEDYLLNTVSQSLSPQAGMTSLASSAAVSFVSNKGNLGATLKSLGGKPPSRANCFSAFSFMCDVKNLKTVSCTVLVAVFFR